MLYVNGEMLKGQEALDRLDKLSKHSHKKFLARCDSGVSENCRFEYELEYRYYIQYTEANQGNLLCLPCSRRLKFSGRSNPNTKHKKIDDSIFNTIETPEKAYALGWIASDGHVNKRGFVIKILASDADVLIKLSESLFANDASITYDKKGFVCLRVDSQQIAKDISRHLQTPFGKKSHTVQYPKQLEKELDVFFVRGVFDGDGTVTHTKNNRPKCNIRSSSFNMLKPIQDRFGGYLWRDFLTWDGPKRCFDFLNILYKDRQDLALKRKISKFHYIQEEFKQRASWDRIDEHWILTRAGLPVAVVYEIPGRHYNGYSVWTCKFKNGNLLVEVPFRRDAMKTAEEWTLPKNG